MQKDVIRSQAKEDGVIKYNNGKPCARGHICERYVANHACVMCIKENESYKYQQEMRSQKQPQKRKEKEENKRIRRNAKRHKRRALEKSAGGSYNVKEIRNLYESQNGKCTICGLQFDNCVKYEIDHIMPISKGGNNSIKNIQLLCRACNLIKSNKYPYP